MFPQRQNVLFGLAVPRLHISEVMTGDSGKPLNQSRAVAAFMDNPEGLVSRPRTYQILTSISLVFYLSR